MVLASARMLRRLPIGSTTSAAKFMRFRCNRVHSTGTDHGNKEAEEDGETKDKFIAKGESLLSVSAPLEADRDAEDDEEDSVEERLESETN